MAEKVVPIIIVILVGILASLSLFHSGFPPTHDGEYHIIRFHQFDKVLRDGVLYPRWAPDLNNGYGIPLFNYVYPLPNYIASFLHTFGISFIDGFKLQMILAIFLGGIFFYIWIREFFGIIAGIVGSVLYTFSPYHFLDIYVRGSVGEVWALALFPAALWSITKFLKENKISYIVSSAIFLPLIIFSHNILGLMFFIFYLFYIGFLMFYMKKFNQTHLFGIAMIILLSVSLSSIFWIPALMEKDYARGLQIFDYARHFPELYQLLIPTWGTGFSGDDLQNAPSYQIGIANLLVVFLSVFVFLIHILKKDARKFVVGFFLLWFFLVFFLMQEKSLLIWENLPFMEYFQFPWRLLSIEILIASFLGACIAEKWKSVYLTTFLVFFTIILGMGYTKPAYYHDRNDAYYTSRSNFIDGTNSPGNSFNTVWMDSSLNKQKNKIDDTANKMQILNQDIRPNRYFYAVRTDTNSKIIVNTAFFPGWKAKIDDREIPVERTQEGIMSFNIQKGEHTVDIFFSDTPIRSFANSISFVSVVILLFMMVRSYGTIKRS